MEKERADRLEIERRLNAVEEASSLKTIEEQHNREMLNIRSARRRFAAICTVVLVFAICVAALLAFALSGTLHYSAVRLAGIFEAAIVVAWSVAIDKCGRHNAMLEQWSLYQKFASSAESVGPFRLR